MKNFKQIILPILAILFCCIAIGGIYEGVFLEPVAGSAKQYFIEGFLICLGGFFLAGIPSHLYLKKKNRRELHDYYIQGMGAGAIYGAVTAPVMVLAKTTVHNELLLDPKHIIGMADIFGSMIPWCILGLIGGFLCSSVFWSAAISRKFNSVSFVSFMFLFMGLGPGLMIIFFWLSGHPY